MRVPWLFILLFAMIVCVPIYARDLIWTSEPVAFEVRDAPIHSFFHSSGADENKYLSFLGGFELKAKPKVFGGFSGVLFEPNDHRLMLLSDTGGVAMIHVQHDQGKITGFGKGILQPLKNHRSQLLSQIWHYDTESVAIVGNKLWVGVETANRIYEFSRDKDGFPVSGRILNVPQRIRKLPKNRGLEALASSPLGSPLKGKVVAIAERSVGKYAPHTEGWIIGGGQFKPIMIARRDEYDVSDAAFLPNGDLLLLERRVRWWSALTVRIRRIKVQSFFQSEPLDGEDFLIANLTQPIDNFEGLHVAQISDDRIILTLVSDNNYNDIQRTLLMQFLLKTK